MTGGNRITLNSNLSSSTIIFLTDISCNYVRPKLEFKKENIKSVLTNDIFISLNTYFKSRDFQIGYRHRYLIDI